MYTTTGRLTANPVDRPVHLFGLNKTHLPPSNGTSRSHQLAHYIRSFLSASIDILPPPPILATTDGASEKADIPDTGILGPPRRTSHKHPSPAPAVDTSFVLRRSIPKQPTAQFTPQKLKANNPIANITDGARGLKRGILRNWDFSDNGIVGKDGQLREVRPGMCGYKGVFLTLLQTFLLRVCLRWTTWLAEAIPRLLQESRRDYCIHQRLG